MERLARWTQIARVGQPEAAVFRQLDEFLNRGAADRVFADQFRALVPVERRGEDLGGAGRAGRDEQSSPAGRSRRHQFSPRSVSRVPVVSRPALIASVPDFTNSRAVCDAGLEGAFGGVPEVDDQRLSACLRQFVDLALDVGGGRRP